MSSYNGSKYISEQLNSILKQDCEKKGLAKYSLLVRDDGSTDGTQDILAEYSEKYPGRIQWYQGTNRGVIKSFFELMAHADNADYYALADQDDYWHHSKMGAGIKRLRAMALKNGKYSRKDTFQVNNQIPLLYCCKPLLVDEKLRRLPVHVSVPKMKPGFGNALIENIVTGCTTVFNNKLRQMLMYGFPEYIAMHDRWMYLIASCFGEIYYDEKPYILYRQHDGNAVGKNTERLAELKYRINKFRKSALVPGRQAQEFMRIFRKEFAINGNRPEVSDNRELLKLFINGKKNMAARKKLLETGRIYRQRYIDHQVFKVLIMLGIY